MFGYTNITLEKIDLEFVYGCFGCLLVLTMV